MARNAGDRGSSKSSKEGPSRREVIVTAAGAGVAGILPEMAGAHTVHRRHRRSSLPTKKGSVETSTLPANFCLAVNAFNNGTASTSPQYFNQNNIKMISVKHQQTYTGWSNVSAALQALYSSGQTPPAQFYPQSGVLYNVSSGDVHGHAYWKDNDNSKDDLIEFHFYFDSSGLITEMRANPGSGYHGTYPPFNACS
jgi:hypothetical protein